MRMNMIIHLCLLIGGIVILVGVSKKESRDEGWTKYVFMLLSISLIIGASIFFIRNYLAIDNKLFRIFYYFEILANIVAAVSLLTLLFAGSLNLRDEEKKFIRTSILSIRKWHRKVGNFRFYLFSIAVIGQISIFAIDIMQLVSGQLIIMPAFYLFYLRIIESLFMGVIIVEIMQFILDRLSITLNLQKHLLIIMLIVLLIVIVQIRYRIPLISYNYCLKGWDLNNEKRFNKALTYLNIAIDLNKKNAAAYELRGWTYTTLKDYKKAIIDYSNAIKLETYYAKNYYGRGFAYYYDGDYVNAIRDWENAIVLDPKMKEELEPLINEAREKEGDAGKKVKIN